MRERRRPDLRPRRQLLDPGPRELGQIGRRSLQRGEGGTARLVGKRDRALGPAGKRLQQRPLRACQILEAVGEDRPPLPGLQLSGDSFRGRPTPEIFVPKPEAV